MRFTRGFVEQRKGGKMKNRTIVLLIIGLVLAAGLVSSSLGKTVEGEDINSGNLALNPGFETLKDDRPLSWKEHKRRGWKVTEDEPYEGERCMQATLAWSSLSQEVRAEAGQSYVLRAYIRSDITVEEKEDRDNTFLTVECLNWIRKVIRRDHGIVNATSSWQKKVRQIYTPPGTRRIRIKLAKRQGEGSVWFDDIKLTRVVSGLVANGSFEALEEGKPSSWKEDGKGGWKVTEDDPYEGERAMEATVAWSFLSQEVRVVGEKSYVFRAFVKSDIPGSEEGQYQNTFLSLQYLGEENKLIKEEYGVVNATSSWEPKTRQIYISPEIVKVRIKLAKRQGEGSVWFDKIEIFEISPLTVLNPGFESMSGPLPDSWREDAQGGWKVEAEDPHGGKSCMKGSVAWSWLSQDIPVGARKYYVVRAQVKSNIIVFGKEDVDNGFFLLQCLNSKDEVIREEYGTFSADLSWEQKEVSIFTAKDTEKLRVRLAKRQGEGSVWFDDVELIKYPFLANIAKDKLFLIFYICLYLTLLVLLLRVVIKKPTKRAD